MADIIDRNLTPIHLMTSHIIGREREVNEIHSIFTKYPLINPVIVLKGIGGIGKSTIAIKYINKFGHFYKHLAWITVKESLYYALFEKDFLETLGIYEKVCMHIKSDSNDKAFELLFQKLSSLEKTLMIIDNANSGNELQVIHDLSHNQNLHILITSRTNLANWPSINIEHLSQKQSIEIFNQFYRLSKNSKNRIGEVLSKFDYLPLLIELIAKSAYQNSIDLEKLFFLYNNKKIKNLIFEDTKIGPIRHSEILGAARRSSIQEYLDFCFKGIEKDLSIDEQNMLCVFCIAPPSKTFTHDILHEIFTLVKITYNADSIYNLYEKGWISKERSGETIFLYKMHPVLQEFIFNKLKVQISFAQPLIDYANTIVNGINLNFPYKVKYKKEVQNQWQEFLFHVEKLFHVVDQIGT